MDEHNLIEGLVNRIHGMNGLLDNERAALEHARTGDQVSVIINRIAEIEGQLTAYLDILSWYVTFHCEHKYQPCGCAAKG